MKQRRKPAPQQQQDGNEIFSTETTSDVDKKKRIISEIGKILSLYKFDNLTIEISYHGKPYSVSIPMEKMLRIGKFILEIDDDGFNIKLVE
jgi:hypothetical protein